MSSNTALEQDVVTESSSRAVSRSEQSAKGASIVVSSRITGFGMSVPERVITNSHFESYLATSDEWIKDRTGIKERRWAEAHESASTFGEAACREALNRAKCDVSEVDGIICATVTPDFVFPSTACVIQGRLGVRKGFAFDVNAVCSGFLYALSVADSLIATGLAKNILVVGTEIFSRLINPNDRSTCILFGDGAGAVLLTSASGGSIRKEDGLGRNGLQTEKGDRHSLRGIYAAELCADGTQGGILNVPLGSAKPATAESLAAGEHYLHMAGREVFKFAVRSLVEVSERILERTGFTVQDVDHFISHQANQRILSAMGSQLGVPESKVLSNVARFGNTSAASLPILLAEAATQGTLKEGDLVLLSAVGGGLTWGAMLLRW